jgi:hypothetical protein
MDITAGSWFLLEKSMLDGMIYARYITILIHLAQPPVTLPLMHWSLMRCHQGMSGGPTSFKK